MIKWEEVSRRYSGVPLNQAFYPPLVNTIYYLEYYTVFSFFLLDSLKKKSISSISNESLVIKVVSWFFQVILEVKIFFGWCVIFHDQVHNIDKHKAL